MASNYPLPYLQTAFLCVLLSSDFYALSVTVWLSMLSLPQTDFLTCRCHRLIFYAFVATVWFSMLFFVTVWFSLLYLWPSDFYALYVPVWLSMLSLPPSDFLCFRCHRLNFYAFFVTVWFSLLYLWPSDFLCFVCDRLIFYVFCDRLIFSTLFVTIWFSLFCVWPSDFLCFICHRLIFYAFVAIVWFSMLFCDRLIFSALCVTVWFSMLSLPSPDFLFVAFVMLYLWSSAFFNALSVVGRFSVLYLWPFHCHLLFWALFLIGGISLHYLCEPDFLCFILDCLISITTHLVVADCIVYGIYPPLEILFIEWHLWKEGLNSDIEFNGSFNINKIYFSPKTTTYADRNICHGLRHLQMWHG